MAIPCTTIYSSIITPMQTKVQKLVTEFTEIEKELSNPEVIADQKRFKELRIRHAQLSADMDLFQAYLTAAKNLADAEATLSSGDADLRELAEEEKKEAKAKLTELEAQLKVALLPKDPNEGKNVIIEIRAGTGGEEAALFAAELARAYFRFAEDNGLKIELLGKSEADAGGVKEIVFQVNGAAAYSKFKFEAGTHRVQRIPATEAKGRIHTSAVTVAVLPEAEEVDITIKPEDIRVDIFCASGPGGQSVNTTYSAIRITHLPTGIVVSQQDEKSQTKNKAKAMQVLRSRLLAHEEAIKAKERGDLRSGMIGSGDRSEKIRTYNFPQDRVTDHRIGQNFSNLPKIMDGDLGDIVDALAEADISEKLKSN